MPDSYKAMLINAAQSGDIIMCGDLDIRFAAAAATFIPLLARSLIIL